MVLIAGVGMSPRASISTASRLMIISKARICYCSSSFIPQAAPIRYSNNGPKVLITSTRGSFPDHSTSIVGVHCCGQLISRRAFSHLCCGYQYQGRPEWTPKTNRVYATISLVSSECPGLLLPGLCRHGSLLKKAGGAIPGSTC